MTITRRRSLQWTAAALATSAYPGLASAQAPAQTWPTRTIRAIVPFAAGSTIDIVGRIVTDPLSRQLGQSIVIENRAGAGGTIGNGIVAKAEPDGYTILIDGAAHSATPAAYPNIPFDVVKDFASVAAFGSVPNVLLVRPESGIKSVRDLIAKGKASELTYASAGVGSTTHWAAERFRVSAGFKGIHVPFTGGPAALTEVMTGRVDFTCMGMGSAISFIQEKKLIPLAVSTPQRSKALPDVPTTLELGLKNSDYIFWLGMFVPAKTPRAIVDRLHAETQRVLKLPDVMDKFAKQGIEPMRLSPTEFDALVKKEVDGNIAFVKAAGLKFN